MPSYLTVLGRQTLRLKVVAAVEALGRPSIRSPEGSDATNWRSIEIYRGGGTLRLNWQDIDHQPDAILRMREGMTAYFRNAKNAPDAARRLAVNIAESFVCAIGVVAEPEFAADESDFDVVWAASDAVDGSVWNGAGLIRSDGRLILDGNGVTELDAPAV